VNNYPGSQDFSYFSDFYILSSKYEKYSLASYYYPVWNSGWPFPTSDLNNYGLIPSW